MKVGEWFVCVFCIEGVVLGEIGVEVVVVVVVEEFGARWKNFWVVVVVRSFVDM